DPTRHLGHSPDWCVAGISANEEIERLRPPRPNDAQGYDGTRSHLYENVANQRPQLTRVGATHRTWSLPTGRCYPAARRKDTQGMLLACKNQEKSDNALRARRVGMAVRLPCPKRPDVPRLGLCPGVRATRPGGVRRSPCEGRLGGGLRSLGEE